MFPTYQSAYRKDHSCETILLKLCNDILWCLEKKEIFVLIGTDLSAAFDTVHHGVLLAVLENYYNVGGEAVQWFQSYLKDRKFKVIIDQVCSEIKTINFSIPQGSRGGPDLYLLYAATIQEILTENINIYAYADDHNFGDSFYPDTKQINERECILGLEKSMVDINNWMNMNRLKMNPDKTEFMYFGSCHQLKKCAIQTIHIVDAIISRANNIRFLGSWLDAMLNFESHVTKKIAIARSNLVKISRIRPYLNTKACEIVIISLVISHIDYCNSILFGISEGLLNKLQVLQNDAAKLILQKERRESSKLCLKMLHWLPVRARIEFKIVVQVLKCLKNRAPEYLTNLLEFDFKGRNLRNNGLLLKVPFVAKKHHASRAFSVCGPKLWNSLPPALRMCTDFDLFRKNLKTHLFNKYFDNSDDFVYY